MLIVEALDHARVHDRRQRFAYQLVQGTRYVLDDDEAARGLQAGALRIVADLKTVLPRYEAGDGSAQSLFFPFIGGLGDALAAASCIHVLGTHHPGTRVTVVCRKDTAEYLALLDPPVTTLPYPITADQLSDFTAYCSLENVHSLPDAKQRSLGDLFSRALGTPKPVGPARVAFNVERGKRPHHPMAVGLHVGPSGNVRTYPLEQLLKLGRLLVEREIAVTLLGQIDTTETAIPDEPPQPPLGKGGKGGFRNLLGKTEAPQKLIAALSRLDLLVCGDSFLLHLAGCLRLPTVAVFSSTSPVLAGDYPEATVLTPSMSCSPCGKTGRICPAGFSRCEAMWHEDLRPTRLCRTVMNRLLQANSESSDRFSPPLLTV